MMGIGRGRMSAVMLALAALLAAPAARARVGAPPAIAGFDLRTPGAEQARFRSPIVAVGVQALSRGDDRKALAAFSKALRTDPQNAYLHFLNALAYHRLARGGDESQGDLADTGYRQALRFDSNAWWAAYGLGLLDVERRDYAAAQDDFARVLLTDRDNGGALHGLAVASYYLGDLALARTAVDRAVRFRPQDRAVLRSAALIAAANGEPDRAKALASQYAAREPQAFRRDFVDGRIADWAVFRAADAGVARPQQAALQQTAPEPPAALTSPAAGPRQVLVDVIYIRTQDSSATSQGVNLLRGLQLQYAYSDSRARSTLPDVAAYQQQAGAAPSLPPLSFSRSITQALGIPAITYSLNIFNSQRAHNDVVARPTLIAQEGQPSSFFSGQELSIGLPGQYGGSLNQIEVGLSLEVTPALVTDQAVTLQVMVKRTAFEIDLAGTFDQSVQTSNNRVSATVTLGYDQTLILTGLIDREKSRDSDRTPLLGGVPVLQYLFNRKAMSDNSRAVLIMLTPHRLSGADPAAMAIDVAKGPASSRVAALQQRWSDDPIAGFRPRPNLPGVFYHLRGNPMFSELRAGDLTLEDWDQPDGLSRAIRQDLQFLYF